MIEINLVPGEFRKKKKKSSLGFNIPLEVVVGVGGALVALLIIVHILLFMINVKKIAEHKNLQNEWNQILPSKEQADGVIQTVRDLQAKLNSINEVSKGTGVIWAEKLNIISDSLPRGVWLKKIELTDEMFFIQGSAISRQNNEMISVHKFTANLKNDKNFIKQMGDLELGSIQSQTIQSTEVADFLLTMPLE